MYFFFFEYITRNGKSKKGKNIEVVGAELSGGVLFDGMHSPVIARVRV